MTPGVVDWRPHLACRVCGDADIRPYLHLGTQAPANALRLASEVGTPEFSAPLSIARCPSCGLSQLQQVVSPERLYAQYPFRAGVSESWRIHCAELAEELPEWRHFVVDIGSNDGTLLGEYAARGHKVLGIDPCPTDPTIPMLATLWSEDVAEGIARMHGQAHLVTATNVFGHVDDVEGFLRGIAAVLAPSGTAIIECPHLLPLLEETAFDTIYHEHLSYWSLQPLEVLCDRTNLKVVAVQSFPELHGGTMRYTLLPRLAHGKAATAVTGLRILESALRVEGEAPYQAFAQRARQAIQGFRETLEAERDAGQRVSGYGASAKGAVRLQASGIGRDLVDAVIDDTPEKQGRVLPGCAIPVVGPELLPEADVLVLLSWNNADALRERARAAGFHGRFLMPHLSSPNPQAV